MAKKTNGNLKSGLHSEKTVSRNVAGSVLTQKDDSIGKYHTSAKTRGNIDERRTEKRKALTLKVFNDIYDDYRKAS